MLDREDLHDYQNYAIDFVLTTHRCGLFLPMGMGKSISSLTAIVDILDSMSATKVLIIAPLRVANTVWHNEAKNWRHTNHLTFSIVTGSEKNRLAKLHEDSDVYVINRENVEWLTNVYKKKWPFDCVVIDESSSFKSHGTRRWKAMRKVLPYIEYLWLLSGTPSPNGLLDLWAQIYLLDAGTRLGRSMTAYKARFFESDYMGYNFTPRKGADEDIHDLISDISISMKAEDYLELPDRIDTRISVDLPAKYKKQYDEFEKEFFIELDDGNEVESESAAVLAGRLVQFCNGALYTDETRNWTEIHKAKLDALADIIEDNPDENILVAYNYKSDLERLTKRFKHAVVMDKKGEAVKEWNGGKIKLLLAHPMSAGHGLNLQHGGAIIVWFGLTWSLECYQQFNARLHRQGQGRPVRIIHLVANGCIDEKILMAIENKAETQNDLLNALKVLTR